MANIFTAPDNTSQQMADSLPQGRAWGKKNIDDSNIRLLINSLAVVYNSTQQVVQRMDEQFRIEQTTELLEEWETSVGLPDECVAGSLFSIAERQQAVIKRLKRKEVVTLADMQEYVDIALPGITTILYAGETYDTVINPGYITGLNDDPKFVLVVEVQMTTESFVYEFTPLPFTGGINTEQLTCVLNKVIPTNVLLLIIYT